MSAFRLRESALAAVAASLAAFATGCGSNPPCEIDISAVDAARSEAKAAETALEEAESQKAQLQRQIDKENARKQELENRKRELLAAIEELEGS
jgi:septal ring factor EnvC (AmiA/AmiB activator)